MNDAQALENAVMTGTPQEVAEISKSLDMKEYANRALALACRFRGLEYVKAIVENDKTIRDANKPRANYGLALLDVKYAPYRKYLLAKPDLLHDDELEKEILPVKQRVEIVKYLCEHKKEVLFGVDDTLLQYSIICHNREIAAALKEDGSKYLKLSSGIFMFFSHSLETKFIADVWNHLEPKEMLGVLQDIAAYMPPYMPPHLTPEFVYNFFTMCGDHFLHPGFLEAVYKLCHKKDGFDRSVLIKTAIDQNSIAHLEMFAQSGWLKRPKLRDEMIAYAAETDKTECTAWLLDFKNSNFDLEAERMRAERKEHRELTAGPNSVYMLRKSWSYKKQKDGTLIITGYKGDQTKVTVPSRIGSSVVTAIGKEVFSTRNEKAILMPEWEIAGNKITEIKLPDTLRSIGERAFYACRNLSEIVIPDSVEEIGRGAFEECSGLRSAVIGEGVSEISDRMFGKCVPLKNIKLSKGLRRIGKEAFRDCSGLTEIVIPDGVKEIDYCAFHSCRSLTEIVIPDSVEKAGESAFHNCMQLRSVTVGESVTEISDEMFRDCHSLQNVKLPNGLRSIGSFAFAKCRELTRIDIPYGVYEIGESAFKGSGLTELIVPDSVMGFGHRLYNAEEGYGLCAFCDDLRYVKLSENISEIGDYAFSHCSSLEKIDLPRVLYRIKKLAFRGCRKLTKLDIPNGVAEICQCAFMNCEGLTELIMPDTVKEIGETAFGGCTALRTVRLSKNLSEISAKMFSYCISLEKVVIPEGIGEIGEKAFAECEALKTVVIPASVKKIDGTAFEKSYNVTAVVEPNSTAEDYCKEHNIKFKYKE